ncbi:MAG: TatD family hydrolase [Patescibacteria group bacterium]
MQISLIDSHCHVQFSAYDQDREAAVEHALEAGIGMVNIGTQFQTSADAVALAARYPDGVWATVGFHPGHVSRDTYHDPWELRVKQHEVFDVEKFRKLASHPKVVAVGECGLDYYRIKNPESRQRRGSPKAAGIMERQREVFRQHIELANEVKKPLVIHCRNAFRDLIQILDSCFKIHDSRLAGVVHFFSGSWEDAQKLLDLGFFLGFGGVITFARDYDELVKNVPLDRLLVETDAPYVSPTPHRGRRNEPAYVVETVKKVAELRDISPEEVAVRTTENARALFGI